MNKEGILIINRKDSMEAQIKNNYRGFDGFYFFNRGEYWEDFELWLMCYKNKEFKLNRYCLADLKYLDDIIEFKKVYSEEIDIIILSTSILIAKYDNFKFIGFDYGEISCYYYSEDDKDVFYYSVLINEVNVRGFKNFIKKLNKYYLFSNIKDAQELHKARVMVFKENDTNIVFEPAVEPDDCEIYQIHLYNN